MSTLPRNSCAVSLHLAERDEVDTFLAEMRQAISIAVFSGMLGVTFFGIVMTPVFYVLVRKLEMWGQRKTAASLSTAQ